MHKIKRVVRSTLAAEILSLGEGLEAGFYYRQMLEEILLLDFKTINIEAYVDNKSVIEALSSTRWWRINVFGWISLQSGND